MKPKNPEIHPPQQWTLQFRAALISWYHTASRDLPWRRTQDPYAIWISEIMLQQTQVDTVIPYWLRFMEALPTVAHLAQVDEERLLKLWEGLGYYSRARNLKKAAEMVMAQHQGAMPQDGAALQKLPGIGPYTAGAIGSIAFGLPLAAVDGNVIRVYSRVLAITVNADTTAGKKLFQALGTELVAPEDPSAYNQAVMELGALVCSFATPRCSCCPVSELCEGRQQGKVLDFPVRTPKTPGRILHWTVTVYHRGRALFLIPRSDETLLKNLWGFPMTLEPEGAPAWGEESGTLGPVKHVFTHQTWIMAVRVLPETAESDLSALYPEGVWADMTIPNHLPLPKAFQKILPVVYRSVDFL